MKRYLMTITIMAALFVAACTPSHVRYKEHPLSKQELISRIGQPDKILKTEDGKEKLVYAYRGEDVTYIYYLLENGVVVEDGMYRY